MPSDDRPLRAKVEDLQQRSKHHYEVIAELCKRVEQLEQQTRPAKERIIHDLRHSEKTQAEIAADHDVTEGYVSQLKSGALAE